MFYKCKYFIFSIFSISIIIFIGFYNTFCLADDNNYDSKIIEQKGNLNQIQQRIKTLKSDLSQKENDKNLTATKISESTLQINEIQQKIQKLDAEFQTKSKTLTTLKTNIKELDKTLKNNQNLLADLLYFKYVNIQQNNVIHNSNVSKNANLRDLYYLQNIVEFQNALLKNTQKDLLKRQYLATNLSKETQNLEKIRQTQNSYKEQLQQQKVNQQKIFNQLDKQVNLQKTQIQILEEDEKNLTKLVEKLTKIAEEQKLKAEKEEKARQAKLLEQSKKELSKSPPSNEKKLLIKDSVSKNNKNLILPISGKIITNFGQKKSDGIISKGVLIAANLGDNVKSIANGKVVFADEMRGFGKLLVVDHQNSYMTVYAHNAEILVELDQIVQAQQSIGKVGEKGMIYFELRKNGKAINPQEKMQ